MIDNNWVKNEAGVFVPVAGELAEISSRIDKMIETCDNILRALQRNPWGVVGEPYTYSTVGGGCTCPDPDCGMHGEGR